METRERQQGGNYLRGGCKFKYNNSTTPIHNRWVAEIQDVIERKVDTKHANSVKSRSHWLRGLYRLNMNSKWKKLKVR